MFDPDVFGQVKAVMNGEGKWPLYLFGPMGSGKTCLALYTSDLVIGSRYWTFQEFQDELLLLHRSDMPTKPLWRAVADLDLLILDEIGLRPNPTEAAWETLYRLADTRDCRKAFYCSNLAPKDLKKTYGDRIYDRMTCGTVVKTKQGSMR